jgi:hypothetical protein
LNFLPTPNPSQEGNKKLLAKKGLILLLTLSRKGIRILIERDKFPSWEGIGVGKKYNLSIHYFPYK